MHADKRVLGLAQRRSLHNRLFADDFWIPQAVSSGTGAPPACRYYRFFVLFLPDILNLLISRLPFGRAALRTALVPP
jgi:hypothetical protein